jgi:hypothetical protein
MKNAPKKQNSFPWKRYALIVLALLIIAGTLMVISMELFFRVVWAVGIALTIGSIAVMLLTYRKSREIKPKAMAISIAMSTATLSVYALFLKTDLGPWAWLAGAIVGVAAGVGWSLITPLFRDGEAIKRAGNIWYLAVWGAIFALNQFLVMALGRSPTLSMILLIFGTGLVIGNSGSCIVGYYRMRAK